MNIISLLKDPAASGRKVAHKARKALRLISGQGGNAGTCPICGPNAFFEIRGPWLRDEYSCRRCRSIPRWRAMMMVLEEQFPDWRSKTVHESSPGGSLSGKLKGECPGYVPSQYFPGQKLGEIFNGFRCEDLARQTFADGSFDVVITSDVLEHLPEARLSMVDIARTLKPGGAHVFTVPWYHWKDTLVRARLEDGKIRHIEEPDYHGNPIDEKGSLVITEWGRELPFLIAKWTGLPTAVFRIVDRSHGIDGKFLEVFVSRKEPA